MDGKIDRKSLINTIGAMIGWIRRRELRNAYVTSFIVKTIIPATNVDKLNFHRCHGELVGTELVE